MELNITECESVDTPSLTERNLNRMKISDIKSYVEKYQLIDPHTIDYRKLKRGELIALTVNAQLIRKLLNGNYPEEKTEYEVLE